VDDLRALDDLDPPEGCQEEFQKMLEDIFGSYIDHLSPI
jgi:hypothetical protein